VFGKRFDDLVYRRLFDCDLSPKLLSRLWSNANQLSRVENKIVGMVRRVLSEEDEDVRKSGNEASSMIVRELELGNIEWIDGVEKGYQVMFMILSRKDIPKPGSWKRVLTLGLQTGRKYEDLYAHMYVLFEDLSLMMNDLGVLLEDILGLKNDVLTDISFSGVCCHPDDHLIEKFVRRNKLVEGV
jgi:hypothetical protein